ncbi:MAG: glycerate kinase [Oscillospiraceae bacterium]|jgi:hydroxypyruvate reductase|nr:glycerate kinase [Oscillospiraceae bacterium]
MAMRSDAQRIIEAALRSAQPDTAVKKALKCAAPAVGKTVLISIGKAGWQMAKAACEALSGQIDSGIVITKYGHGKGALPDLEICEAGHPVPDENSFAATNKAMALVSGLSASDTVLFLISGGGSALFESPLVPGEELVAITKQMLASGADIVEMNTVRKRLSAVKGGKFAQLCAPAKVFAVVLSDIIGDPLDMIASGPTCPDSSTSSAAAAIVEKYSLNLSQQAAECLKHETPKTLSNVETHITGSVRQLCSAAFEVCRSMGYEPFILTDSLCCTARDAGSFLASIARCHRAENKPMAFIAGGETVVQLTGHGLGGRNQEIALSAAEGIAGLHDTAVFSLGSDGTDGPTDAAGGYCDGETRSRLLSQGISISQILAENDAYHALEKCDGLIITGPTGTNVNDVSVVLLG